MTGHAAIVLAAGGSTRLGASKQLLGRQSEPLVRRALRLCLQTAPARTIVVVGADAERIGDAIAGLTAEVHENPMWARGLSTSLAVAADALRDHQGPALITGCDQPALEYAHLDALLRGASEIGVAATLHGDRLGAPAVVPASMLRERIEASDRGLGPLLNRLPRDAVWTLVAPMLMFDVDTRDDLDAAIRNGWLDPVD